MNIRNISFKKIGNQSSLRFDVGYRTFFDIKRAVTWDSDSFLYLSDFLKPINSGKIKKDKDGILENEEYLVDLTNIIRRFDCLSNVMLVSEIGSDKNVLQNGDIVIPKMQPRMGNIFTNTEHNRYIGSSELIEYSCDRSIIDTKVLFYILTHPLFQQSLLYTESGKTHRRVSPSDLLKYKIPYINTIDQQAILKEVKPLEDKILVIRKDLKSITETINNTFAKRFNLNFVESDLLQNKLIYHSNYEEIANEELKFDISLKYRRLFRDNIYYPSPFSWKPLGKIVKVKGGKRLPKGEDVIPEDTGYRYIRVEDLDTFGHFYIDNIQFITEKNHSKIKNYIAETDDILLTIVGATVGKCGVVPIELNGEHISENFARLIINDKEKYKSLYIMYFFMSKLGQYQINEYKGRGSQGKLAIFRVKKIQIPNLSLPEQELLLNDIHNEVQRQRTNIRKMEELRREIDNILTRYLVHA